MRILIGALAVAFLGGCTSPSELMSGAPIHTYTTTKLPKDVALCVYPAWQDYRSTSVLSETTNGYRIVVGTETGQTDDILNIDLSDNGKGSVIKLYQRMPWSQIGRSGLKPALNKCL